MEIIVNNDPNLHPLWAKHFGSAPKVSLPATLTVAAKPAATQPTAATVGISAARVNLAQAAPARPQIIHDNDGWYPTCRYRPAPGEPVTVKKQTGPQSYISTTVMPGDARYPVEFLTVPATAAKQHP
ncbi:hypothetical protein [Aromatoleum bremense]|uniref:Uncharacterized protein n=1 Tax=Aromatoleum bremense TaxID=76115 RepID=A0ABX1P135_9RHOO|nr:hypothetical protein [Aromatoleum bremense]NMG17506.1 hypothetical protein [Aromatoleum bremense]QTQ33205.1 Uncharacterized protein pbN1_32170 [Aromatoleum bremense]